MVVSTVVCDETPALATARQYVKAGLSVIPVKADGTKAPLLNGWREFAERRPTGNELRRWFDNGTVVGIGIPGGPASGNLAVLDFETAACWEQWLAAIPSDTSDHLDTCPLCRTPRGGAHVYVRLPESVPGVKLARDKDGKTVIEIRGDNHQVVAPGSPASCHPSGRTWEWERRGWIDGDYRGAVPFSVWFEWLELAASFDEYQPAKEPRLPAEPRRDRDPSDTDPGTDFNRRGTWEEAGLFAAGWTWARQLDGDRGFVRRPGKSQGTSGTVGLVTAKANGWPLLYVFTSNGHPFEQNASYDKFGVFARLNHRSDFKAAAKALAAMGYGGQKARPKPRATADSPKAERPEPATQPEPTTAVGIIAAYFRTRYGPTFRSGDSIYGRDGRLIRPSEACGLPDSTVIAKLATAEKAPCYKGGGVNHNALPGFFRTWSRIAWADLLNELPEEVDADAAGIAPARDQFVRLLREAMLTDLVLGDVIEGTAVTQTERRPLAKWCQRLAKPGLRWEDIRGRACWTRLRERDGGELVLQIAIRHELLAELRADARLRELGPVKFARLANKYGVGRSSEEDRPSGRKAVVLADDFVADLVAGFHDDEVAPTPEGASTCGGVGQDRRMA